MRKQKSALTLGTLVAITLISVIAATHASAQEETVLYSFNSDGLDGEGPYGGLTFDAAGNLYGTTPGGGGTGCFGGGCGVVFELMPQSGGGWTEKIIHNFNDSSTDGQQPVASLILDAAGNLYGTTRGGGSSVCGIVFELMPQDEWHVEGKDSAQLQQ